MDLVNNTPCIISVGKDGWYGVGVERLHRSLIYHGYAGSMLLWKDSLPPNSPTHQENPYAFKIYAFIDAIQRGYKVVMWLDSSFWCIKNPHHLFDIIYDNGVFAFRSGYNCAQTCPDNLLARMGYTRDEAEKLPEIATGMVGLNIDNPNGKAVFDLWAELCFEGYFKNDRHHNPAESADKRYLHGRQDQAAMSMVIHKLGLNVDFTDYVAYYGTNHNPEKTVFFIGGL
jgi:hypothetical protein